MIRLITENRSINVIGTVMVTCLPLSLSTNPTFWWRVFAAILNFLCSCLYYCVSCLNKVFEESKGRNIASPAMKSVNEKLRYRANFWSMTVYVWCKHFYYFQKRMSTFQKNSFPTRLDFEKYIQCNIAESEIVWRFICFLKLYFPSYKFSHHEN